MPAVRSSNVRGNTIVANPNSNKLSTASEPGILLLSIFVLAERFTSRVKRKEVSGLVARIVPNLRPTVLPRSTSFLDKLQACEIVPKKARGSRLFTAVKAPWIS
jgi:hypothetical protein